MSGGGARRSALYRGWVRHRRLEPVPHEFRYPTCHALIDLGELPRLFDERLLWSVERPNLAWFRRADYLGPAEVPLDRAVRDLVEERTGRRPAGRIELLTTLRHLGLCFNPLSVYYCRDAEDRIEAVVGEITNTPWNQRHAYVFGFEPGAARLERRDPKRFHVSPFLPMHLEHDWRFTPPGSRLALRVVNREAGRRVFEAALVARRRELTTGELARALARFPVAGLQTLAGIYWQALRLRLKGAPFFEHPDRRPRPAEETP